VTVVLVLWALVLGAAFVLYPRLMIKAIGALLVGAWTLLVDAFGLLLIWI
jgi:hypothetical protein